MKAWIVDIAGSLACVLCLLALLTVLNALFGPIGCLQ